MGQVDVLRLVVEDGGLDGAVDELVRVAAEELVERVVARDVHREAGAAAAGAAPHLAEARRGARVCDAHGCVELADVYPELQRVRRDHRQQLALREAVLDLAPLGGGVARAVGGDQVGEVAVARVLEPQPGELLDQLYAAARLQKADRPDAALDQAGEDTGRLGQGGGAGAGRLIDQRRVPHRDLAFGARRAVAVDELEFESRQFLGELRRVRDRRAREQEARLGPVGARQPS